VEKKANLDKSDFQPSLAGLSFVGGVLTQTPTPEVFSAIYAQLNRMRKNSCFVSGHDVSRAVND
jgi:hypothetical protein